MYTYIIIMYVRSYIDYYAIDLCDPQMATTYCNYVSFHICNNYIDKDTFVPRQWCNQFNL